MTQIPTTSTTPRSTTHQKYLNDLENEKTKLFQFIDTHPLRKEVRCDNQVLLDKIDQILIEFQSLPQPWTTRDLMSRISEGNSCFSSQMLTSWKENLTTIWNSLQKEQNFLLQQQNIFKSRCCNPDIIASSATSITLQTYEKMFGIYQVFIQNCFIYTNSIKKFKCDYLTKINRETKEEHFFSECSKSIKAFSELKDKLVNYFETRYLTLDQTVEKIDDLLLFDKQKLLLLQKNLEKTQSKIGFVENELDSLYFSKSLSILDKYLFFINHSFESSASMKLNLFQVKQHPQIRKIIEKRDKTREKGGEKPANRERASSPLSRQ